MTKKPSMNDFKSLEKELKVLQTCYHEAGHAVIGHVIGWELERMVAGHGVGKTNFTPTKVLNPLTARDKTERAQRFATQRRVMAVLVGGVIAETIHQRLVYERGYSSRAEARFYDKWWKTPISICYPMRPDEDPESDYFLTVRDAVAINTATNLFAFSSLGPTGEPAFEIRRQSQRAVEKQIRAEITLAEEKAEQLLLRDWKAVEDIALAIRRSKSGCLYRRHLLARLIRHGVEVQGPDS